MKLQFKHNGFKFEAEYNLLNQTNSFEVLGVKVPEDCVFEYRDCMNSARNAIKKHIDNNRRNGKVIDKALGRNL